MINDDDVLQVARYSAIHITTILSYDNDTNGSTQLGEKLRADQGERTGPGGDGCSPRQVYYLCFTFSGAQSAAFFHDIFASPSNRFPSDSRDLSSATFSG